MHLTGRRSIVGFSKAAENYLPVVSGGILEEKEVVQMMRTVKHKDAGTLLLTLAFLIVWLYFASYAVLPAEKEPG